MGKKKKEAKRVLAEKKLQRRLEKKAKAINEKAKRRLAKCLAKRDFEGARDAVTWTAWPWLDQAGYIDIFNAAAVVGNPYVMREIAPFAGIIVRGGELPPRISVFSEWSKILLDDLDD